MLTKLRKLSLLLFGYLFLGLGLLFTGVVVLVLLNQAPGLLYLLFGGALFVWLGLYLLRKVEKEK